MLSSYTASDQSPGQLDYPATQKFVILRSSDSKRYTGTDFTSTTDYMLPGTVEAGPVFQYTDSNLLSDTVFGDGLAYSIKFRIKDKAGNETWSAWKDFRYDAGIPEASVSSPPASGLLGSLPELYGLHGDPDPDTGDAGGITEPSGVDKVQLSLLQMTGSTPGIPRQTGQTWVLGGALA